MTDQNDDLFGEHRDPEAIRKDIRETTADITEKLEALQSKLQPEAIVAEATGEVRDQALALFTKARQHPAALALLGIGAAVIVGRAIGGSRSGSGGSNLFSLALGAVIGATAYRVLAGDAYREEEEPEGRLTQETSAEGPPVLAAVS